MTKSGTNQFHGAAYEYNRTNFGYANDWFNKQAELESGLPNSPGKLIRNTFGASLGGPIWKNKLFFFFNYEGQRTARETSRSRRNRAEPELPARESSLTNTASNPNDPTCAQTGTQIIESGASRDPRCALQCLWSCTTPGPNSAVLAASSSNIPTPNGATEGRRI